MREILGSREDSRETYPSLKNAPSLISPSSADAAMMPNADLRR
jgi:hypothetical protein